MPKNIDITIAPHTEGLKPRTTKGFRGSLKTKALWGLALALVFTSVALAAGYKCVPCKANYYCKKGVRYECPTERPVTFGTGAKSVDECHTCLERDGEIYPAYDIVTGDCVACWQMPETNTPYWNGTACSACPENTEWDSEGLTCKSSIPTPTATACTEDEDCVFKIPHNGGFVYLVESVPNSTFASISPQSAAEETTEFLSTYGIVNVSRYFPDHWAGAMKYCQDKGLRLPTMDELLSIMNVVYGTNNTCTKACNNVNSQYVGAQTGRCCFYSLTVANQSLRNFLGSNSTTTSVTDTVNWWSSAEISGYYAYTYYSNSSASGTVSHSERHHTHLRALCVR